MKSKDRIKGLFLQAIKFFGLSGIGWLLDFSIYTVLGLWSNNFVFNNIISSWVGVTFVFVFSTRKVFQNQSRVPLWIKYLIYVVYQAILIFLMSQLIGIIDLWITKNIMFEIVNRYSFIAAKLIATPITMVLNFFVMKNLIERIK